MFVGSIPADMQSIIKDVEKDWPVDEIYVGTSGNFTVERAMHPCRQRLHSNDVTLYSSVIGGYLSEHPTPFRFNEDFEQHYGWLKDYLETTEDQVATILLTTRLMQGVGKEHNPYYAKMLRAYRRQWPTIHEKTRDKIAKMTIRLASYSPEDVATWIDRVPEDQAMICYPPFFGESRDYENYFKHLEQIFLWDAPTFEPIFGDRLHEFFEKVTRHRSWIFGTKDRMEEFEPYLRGTTKTSNRGVPIWVYSNTERRHLVQPRQKIEPLLNPHIGPDMDIGSKLSLAVLSYGQFTTLRSEYMNHNIKPGSPSLALAVLANGYIIGCIAISNLNNAAGWMVHTPGPSVYMLSDFPVPNTKYKKLAKLVIYAALSKEANIIYERLLNHRIRSLVTTAFTNNPVSMKYRGILKLAKRADSPTNEHKFMLNYYGLTGQWTLAEGLETWKKKHGQTIEGADKRENGD